MLKKIPDIISPDLMKTLMEMGHGDEICLADGNFPSASCAQRIVRLSGHTVAPVLEAILQFVALDTAAEDNVMLMDNAPNKKPPIWNEYERIIGASEERDAFPGFKMIERFAFYERAKRCFAIVATSETAVYANIILKMGVVNR